MKIVTATFFIIEWDIEDLVVNNDPEMPFIELDTQEALGYKPRFLKELAYGHILIKWSLSYSSKTSSRIYFKYVGEYKVKVLDYFNFQNEGDKIREICKSSFFEFTKYFDERKAELGLKEHLIESSESDIDQLVLDVIEEMTKKLT